MAASSASSFGAPAGRCTCTTRQVTLSLTLLCQKEACTRMSRTLLCRKEACTRMSRTLLCLKKGVPGRFALSFALLCRKKCCTGNAILDKYKKHSPYCEVSRYHVSFGSYHLTGGHHHLAGGCHHLDGGRHHLDGGSHHLERGEGGCNLGSCH